MSLQNRVTPFGDIVAVAGRGLMMGNRGVLHDEARTIVRAWQTRRWIACVLKFRGRYRKVMQPRRYTELFFLDEATSFAAGHRPCAECRNADYRQFKALWAATHGAAGADEIDRVLHDERLEGRRKRMLRAPFSSLPDGAYVAVDERAWLVWRGDLLAWSDTAYAERRPIPPRATAVVLTPPSVLALFAAGYPVAVHPSASPSAGVRDGG